MMFALRASDVRLRRVNFFVSPFWVSGPKMDAGANETVTRTEAKKYCPELSIGAKQ
jgi:hypothetical protein